MSRIRTIKPEFWQHEVLSSLPEPTHILAAALLNYCDDEGYFRANPGLVKAACSPLREPSVSIHDSLTNLSIVGYIQLGTGSDGIRYGRVVKFDEHQRVNRATPSKIKEMQIAWGDSVSPHAQLTEGSPPEGKGKEREVEHGKEGKRVRAPRFDASACEIPAWLDPDLWQRWCSDRAKRGKAITEEGARQQLADLAQWHADGMDAEQSIRDALKGGWQGLFPPKNNVPRGTQPNRQIAQEDRNKAALAGWQPEPSHAD